MKIKKIALAIVFGIALAIFLLVFVIGQGSPSIPPGIQNVFGPYPHNGCFESDAGLNIYMTGNNILTTGATNISGKDICLSSTILAEGVCGSWVDNLLNTNIYSNFAYLVTVDCNASGMRCNQGMCLNASPQPDLTVVSLNYSFQNVTGSSQINVTATTVFKNIGNAPATASLQGLFTNELKYDCFGAPPLCYPGTGILIQTGFSILPGQTYAVTRSDLFSTPVTLTLNATADLLNSIVESNENNNKANITFSCSNGICFPGNIINNATMLADISVNLTLINIQNNTNSSQPFGDYLANFSITYQNLGSGPAISIGGIFSTSGPAGGGSGPLPTPPLSSGQTVIRYQTQTISGPNIYGTWTAFVQAGPSSTLPESNYNNNNATIMFTI